MWTIDKINDWYFSQGWLAGCNYLPSSAINQLEMFQEDSFDFLTKGNKEEEARLKLFTQEILDDFREDERILMWDLYNEPGQFGIGDELIKKKKSAGRVILVLIV